MKRLRLCVCVLTCCLATYAAPVSGSNPPGTHNQHGNEPVWEHNLFSAGYDPITFCGGTVSAIKTVPNAKSHRRENRRSK